MNYEPPILSDSAAHTRPYVRSDEQKAKVQQTQAFCAQKAIRQKKAAKAAIAAINPLLTLNLTTFKNFDEQATLFTIHSHRAPFHVLILNGLSKLTDTFIHKFTKIPRDEPLVHVDLRGCSGISQKAINAWVDLRPMLTVLGPGASAVTQGYLVRD